MIPSFQPTLNDELRQIINQPKLLFEEMKKANAPLVISFPEKAALAAREFQAVLADFSLSGRVYAAHKATNSLATIRAVKGVCRIDVASLAELNNALAAGFAPDEIIATGLKNDIFLTKLVEHDITVSIDSTEELKRLQKLLPADKQSPILLRLSRSMLNMPGVTRLSRLGHDAPSYTESVHLIKDDSRFRLLGLSYHIDTASNEEKHYAAKQALGTLLELQADGLEAYVLDIGGGFGSEYGMTKSQLDELSTHLKTSSKLGVADATWQRFDYGLSRGQGALRGIDIASSEVGAARLRNLLERADDNGVSLAQMIGENLIELWLEPGAAIFGSSSMVASMVIETKQIDGETIVTIDAHRNQLCFENNEAPADPIVITQSESGKSGEGFVVGHLCTESDFISYRKIHFESLPKAGDILLFTHTGAYRAHFGASSSIGQPLAKQFIYQRMGGTYTLKETE